MPGATPEPGAAVAAAAANPAADNSVAAHEARISALLGPVFARLRDATPDELAIDDPALAGRVTARDLASPIPLPPFDNSQLDGYAVRLADLPAALAPGASFALRIGHTIAAGDAPPVHEPGTAMPVMTGAAIPHGADAVIPIERADPPRFTELRRAGEAAPLGEVRFSALPAPGEFVRRAGSDLPRGAELLPAGARLGPARIGLLANAGLAAVPVRPLPRVLLVTTGDEVASPGVQAAPGHVYDANTPLLAAALRGAGATVTTRRAADDPEEFARTVAALAPDHDLLVTSGGISAGAFEVVREALAPRGVRFLSLALQPGGPQGIGLARFDGASGEIRIPALCFPGNPVSSALSLELFLAPLLRAHTGRPAARRAERRALAHDVESPATKHQLRRGRIEPDGSVRLTPPSSHLLADLAEAQILAHIPVGVSRLDAGAEVDIWRIDD